MAAEGGCHRGDDRHGPDLGESRLQMQQMEQMEQQQFMSSFQTRVDNNEKVAEIEIRAGRGLGRALRDVVNPATNAANCNGGNCVHEMDQSAADEREKRLAARIGVLTWHQLLFGLSLKDTNISFGMQLSIIATGTVAYATLVACVFWGLSMYLNSAGASLSGDDPAYLQPHTPTYIEAAALATSFSNLGTPLETSCSPNIPPDVRQCVQDLGLPLCSSTAAMSDAVSVKSPDDLASWYKVLIEWAWFQPDFYNSSPNFDDHPVSVICNRDDELSCGSQQNCSGHGICTPSTVLLLADHHSAAGTMQRTIVSEICRCAHVDAFGSTTAWRGRNCSVEIKNSGHNDNAMCRDGFSKYFFANRPRLAEAIQVNDCAAHGVCVDGRCYCRPGFRGVSCTGGPPPQLAQGILEAVVVLFLWCCVCFNKRARAKEELSALQPKKRAEAATAALQVEPEMFSVCVTAVPRGTGTPEVKAVMEKFGDIMFVQIAYDDAPLKQARDRLGALDKFMLPRGGEECILIYKQF